MRATSPPPHLRRGTATPTSSVSPRSSSWSSATGSWRSSSMRMVLRREEPARDRDLDPHPHVDLPGHADLLHRRRIHQRGLMAFGEPARRVVRDLAACAVGLVARPALVFVAFWTVLPMLAVLGTPVRDGANRRARGGAPDLVPGRLPADGRGGSAAAGGASALRRACARGARGGSGDRRRGAVRARHRMDRRLELRLRLARHPGAGVPVAARAHARPVDPVGDGRHRARGLGVAHHRVRLPGLDDRPQSRPALEHAPADDRAPRARRLAVRRDADLRGNPRTGGSCGRACGWAS